ncbi:beta-1,3-galactosyltransferase 1-like [Branchiostoma lanceolatum]|uniref:beta-1,3-galactosyltransferase 1-like n=1 Tax=Branchiostoma lanceolatum TaxID=7740 RepID=UPI0034555518
MGKLCTSKAPQAVLVVCVVVLLYAYVLSPLHQYVTSVRWPLQERGSSQDRPDFLRNVLNPHPFTFTLNNPDKCKGEDVFLLIIVTTPPDSQSQRQVIRETWGDESNIPGVVIRTIFPVGVSDNAGTQQALEDENENFGDIIQENFADTHRNATLKTIMYLKWALMFCPDAKYVMKTSPDVFVNIFSLVNYLKGLPASRATKLLFGWVNTDKRPVRDPNSAWKQWHVAKDEFPSDTYPPYTWGFAYVMSNDMPRLLYETSLTTKYLFMEDVYLGICLEKLSIAPRHHGGFYPWFVEINSCKFEWLIVSRGVGNPEKMMKFWKALTSKC